MTAITNPTLQCGASLQFFSSASTTLTLYGCTETVTKDANLIDFPMPLSDSDQKIMMDFMGASRSIQIDGVVTGSDIGGAANLYKYARDITGLKGVVYASLISGNQGSNGGQAGYTYSSYVLNLGTSSPSTMSVYVMSANVKAEPGNTNSFSYSINLMECSGTTSV